MKKVIIGISAIIIGGLLLIGTFLIPQKDPFAKNPPETSPVKTETVDITENNFTISNSLRAYSTIDEFKKQIDELGYSDKAYLYATDNKGEPGGWMVSPTGKSNKLMGGDSKNGVIVSPIYANDPKGSTVSDIKNALTKRDDQFAKGTLIPNKQNNRTLFFMTDTYKTKEAVEEWYKNEKITPETKILKTLQYGVVIDQSNIQGTFYDLKEDSNAVTVNQILNSLS